MATRDELEAAIDAHPDQADTYLVLADLLQEQQDPRGELIALHRSKDPGAKARATVLQRELGPVAPRYGGCAWFCGFVSRYKNIVDEDDQAEVRATLDHPSLRHLVDLDLDLAGSEYDERQWLIEAIAAQPRPCWRSLSINSYWRGGNDPPSGELDLSALWAVLPRIQTVRVTARYLRPGLDELDHGTLERLTLDGEVTATSLRPVFSGSTPKLAELELYDVDADQLGAVIEAATAPPALAKLVVSSPRSRVVSAISARYPMVTFVDRERERYEQTGE